MTNSKQIKKMTNKECSEKYCEKCKDLNDCEEKKRWVACSYAKATR
jgi:hypothetical protein